MDELPYITIIFPLRNEGAFIQRGLQAITAQNYPVDHMDILIADGMSTDDTRRVIQEFEGRHPELKLQILNNLGKIVPIGMNIALRQARGEIIIRVDGHCIIAPDYVRNCVEHLLQDGVDGVGGSMETVGESQLAKAIAIGMSSPFGVGNSAFRTISGKSMFADTVPFPAYTRNIIERAGPYDEELVRNQDDEYNYRIRELGGKILLAEDVHSTYFSRGSLKTLWRQYFQYGFWKVRVLQKHPRQMSLRQYIPAVFVLALLGSIFLAFFPICRPLSLVTPLLYLVVNFFVSINTASKHGWQYLPSLPLIFTILHMSYGLGFLAGMLRFAHRWKDKQGKMPSLEDVKN
jgi:succinoglycan biosynthesis protein ExoA